MKAADLYHSHDSGRVEVSGEREWKDKNHVFKERNINIIYSRYHL